MIPDMAKGRKLTQAEMRLVGKVYNLYADGAVRPIMDLVNSVIVSGDLLMLDFLVTYGHLKSGQDRIEVKKTLLALVIH